MAMRLTLIAGSGALVPPVAAAARLKAEALQIIDIVAERAFEADDVKSFQLANAPALLAVIKDFGATHLVLAGGVRISDSDREAIASAFGLMGRIAGSLGDVGLAGVILAYCRTRRIRLMGAHEIAPDLLAPVGLIAGPAVTDDVKVFLGPALDKAKAVGAIDLGQSIVVAGERAVAAEDAGGTDQLLARIAQLRADDLIGDGRAPLILAKAVKPKQPPFADLPAIGPETIAKAAAAGIRIVVVEAGRSLLLERAALEAEAARLGVSVVGLRHG